MFSSPAAALSCFISFWQTSARFQFLVIASSWMFLFCFNNYLVTNRIFLSKALQSLSNSQKVHFFSVALTLLQKVLKVSFFICCLNSKFRIIGFSVGLKYDRRFLRKWSHVQSLDSTSFGSAPSQSWISLVIAMNPRSVFTLSFEINMLFFKFNICIFRFFLCCCCHICNTSFNCMFRRFRILCFVTKLVLFNDFVKSQGGNPSGLNCKFCIPRVVVAVSNTEYFLLFILFPIFASYQITL